MLNHLYILLKLYPNAAWNWLAIFENPNTTIEMMREYSTKRLYYHMPSNPNLTWDVVQKELSEDWNWRDLSLHKCITPDIVRKNPNLSWDWLYLSSNPNLDWEFIQENLAKPWDWGLLSENPCITGKILEENQNLPWNWARFMRYNPNITAEMIEQYPKQLGIKWNWYFLSNNHHVSQSTIKKYLDKLWSWIMLVDHKGITWDFVQEHITENWNWSQMSKKSYITWEIVQANPAIKWDYGYLSVNPNITWEIIQQNPDKLWNRETMFKNPNFTWQIIRDNPDIERNYRCLSENSFNKHPVVRKRLLAKKYFSIWRHKCNKIKTIRDEWMNIYGASMDLIRLRYGDVVDRNLQNKSPRLLI